MKASTEKITRWSTTMPPSVTGCTARGCTRRVISRRACFTRISTRTILMPPPVEPALVATPDSSSMKHRREHRPGQVVDGGEAGGAADRDGVEHAVAQRLAAARRCPWPTAAAATSRPPPISTPAWRAAPGRARSRASAPLRTATKYSAKLQLATSMKTTATASSSGDAKCAKLASCDEKPAQAHGGEHVHHRVHRRHAAGPVGQHAQRPRRPT